MDSKTRIVAIILASLLLFLAISNGNVDAANGDQPAYKITWSTTEIARAISPGHSWETEVSFASKSSLSNADIFITPSLKPFVFVDPDQFENVEANNCYNIHLAISVSAEALPGQIYEGTVFLRADHRAYPQSIKIRILVAAPLENLTEQEYERTRALNSEAMDQYATLQAMYGAEQASQMVVAWLKQQPEIMDAGITESGDIWLTYKTGLDHVIFTSGPDMNGSAIADASALPNRFMYPSASISSVVLPGNKNVAVLSPFYSQPLRENPSDEVREILSTDGYCVTTARDQEVTVDFIKTLSQYGTVDWSTHGGVVFGNVGLATGEEPTWTSYLEHLPDVANFRIMSSSVEYDIVNNISRDFWVILPSFIKRYAVCPSYPSSIIHTDACDGLKNTSMAEAFVESGAYVCLGWNATIYAHSATETATSLFRYLSDGMTLQQAYDKLGSEGKTVEPALNSHFGFYPTNHGDISLKQLRAWPMFGHDLQHTGRGISGIPETPTTKWVCSTGVGAAVSSLSLGDDGSAYVGSSDGNLYAVSPNGILQWSYDAGDAIYFSSPAVGIDGTVYVGVENFVGGYGGYLFAINPDGSEKWKFSTGPIDSSPTIGDDGTIYVGSSGYGSTKLYAVNPDGSLKWTFMVSGSIFNSSPAIGSDGTVYIGSMDKNVYAINPDGTLKWSFDTGNFIQSSPAIAPDGTIYIGTFYDDPGPGKLFAINSDGSLKWSFDTDSLVLSPVLGDDGTIFAVTYPTYSGTGRLYAVGPNGVGKWSFYVGAGFICSPLIGSDNTICIGAFNGGLYALKPDGGLKWSFFVTGGVTSLVIGDNSTIYAGCSSGKLYAIGGY